MEVFPCNIRDGFGKTISLAHFSTDFAMLK